MAIMKGAEPFLLPGGEDGVLLVHGFTGSPSEMRLLGEYLNRECGFTVLAPRLCGHGTTVSDMENTKWPQWYGAVEDGYHFLQGLCSTISVVGLSMGGLFTLKLSTEYAVNKIVSLNSPIFIADKRLKFLPVVKLFRKYEVKKRRKLPNLDPSYSVYYEKVPLKSIASLQALIRHVEERLSKVETPILVVQSKHDRTIKPESGAYIYEKVSSRDKEMRWFERSGHLISLDIEREQAFKVVADFLHK
ncbi:MAG: alpha/beta fold hydrolase [Pelosinus sp.]|nr:alpha/beta fold hydrolase [Pelosinus sp.]